MLQSMAIAWRSDSRCECVSEGSALLCTDLADVVLPTALAQLLAHSLLQRIAAVSCITRDTDERTQTTA